jgi:hypothetical protein
MKQKTIKRTNVNSKQNYSKFGQHLHYLTPEKLQVLWEAVDELAENPRKSGEKE